MSLSALLQLSSACVGFLGSIFFTLGIVRQDASAMAKLSGTYYDANPHVVSMLAEQRADYIIGGLTIAAAFTFQFVSYLVPANTELLPSISILQIACSCLAASALGFIGLRALGQRLAAKFKRQILSDLKN